MVRVTALSRHEHTSHFGIVNCHAGLGLEPQTPAGKDDFAPPILRQDDVVIEDAKYFHDIPSVRDLRVTVANRP